jgi:hypothetical protein
MVKYDIRQEEATGIEDELVDFSKDPLVGIQIWSSPVGGGWWGFVIS